MEGQKVGKSVCYSFQLKGGCSCIFLIPDVFILFYPVVVRVVNSVVLQLFLWKKRRAVRVKQNSKVAAGWINNELSCFNGLFSS